MTNDTINRGRDASPVRYDENSDYDISKNESEGDSYPESECDSYPESDDIEGGIEAFPALLNLLRGLSPIVKQIIDDNDIEALHNLLQNFNRHVTKHYADHEFYAFTPTLANVGICGEDALTYAELLGDREEIIAVLMG